VWLQELAASHERRIPREDAREPTLGLGFACLVSETSTASSSPRGTLTCVDVSYPFSSKLRPDMRIVRLHPNVPLRPSVMVMIPRHRSRSRSGSCNQPYTRVCRGKPTHAQLAFRCAMRAGISWPMDEALTCIGGRVHRAAATNGSHPGPGWPSDGGPHGYCGGSAVPRPTYSW
jgi:hypothetical protein